MLWQVYLNDGWPISSADPLALLGDRGPYIAHINTEPSKIICNLEQDKVVMMIRCMCCSASNVATCKIILVLIIESSTSHLPLIYDI